MSVRLKLALTVFATGLLTAALVIATVLFAFRRFEREMTYHRASEFLGRVVALHDDLFDLHERQPAEFRVWLKNLVLYEPDTQLYLLDGLGTVIASSGEVKLAPGFRVALGPVRQALQPEGAAYVMGDDPERMDADAVISARPLRRAVAPQATEMPGYLYLVAHTSYLPAGGWAGLRSSLAQPVMGLVVAIVALTTLVAAWVIAAVTRPLRRLTDAVVALTPRALDEGGESTALPLLEVTRDEFGQLARAFQALLAKLREQWAALLRLDHFRREAVSNLSHDLRSPLTATVPCVETLEVRWAADAQRGDDRHLVEVALRNTRNASRMVQSLGDLARLDEATFKLRSERVDLRELLDDIHLRFAERAARGAVSLSADLSAEAVIAVVDVELFERAIANLLDNALKFSRRGDAVVVRAAANATEVQVDVDDTGPGIAAADVPRLFDRFYQSRQSVAPATGEGGKGLGLAIVKRIAELHGGRVDVDSEVGRGTRVRLTLPLTT